MPSKNFPLLLNGTRCMLSKEGVTKNMKKTNLLAILTLAATPALLHAQTTAYSDVVGYMQISIPAGRASLVSFPLGNSAITSGSFSGKSGNVFSTSASLAGLPNALANRSNEPAYYAEITSGPNSGLILEIIAKSSGSITFGDASSLTGNETFQIKKFTTLGDVLGAGNSAGLLGGDSVTNADVVWAVVNGAWKQYFFYDDGNGGDIDPLEWQTPGSNGDKSDTRIDPDQGVLIVRKAGSNRTVTITGAVKSTATIAPLPTGAQIITNPYPTDKTLGTLNLRTGSSSTGLVEGDSVNNSDIIYKLDNGVWKQYFVYNDGSGGEIDPVMWQTPGSNLDQSGVAVSAGEALLLIRRGTAFNWSPEKPNF
jgi:uncharacterized protein (TIGR02597 family)